MKIAEEIPLLTQSTTVAHILPKSDVFRGAATWSTRKLETLDVIDTPVSLRFDRPGLLRNTNFRTPHLTLDRNCYIGA